MATSLLAFQKEPLAFQVEIDTSAFAADSFQVDAFQISWDGAFQIDGEAEEPETPEPPVLVPFGGWSGAPARQSKTWDAQWDGRSDASDILLVLSVMLPVLEEDDHG